MKKLIKLEELGLLMLFSAVYFYYCQGSIVFFALLFFAPDVSFILFIAGKKVATTAYNLFHHKGIICILILLGYVLHNDLVLKIGLIFMAHSCFDRVMGYGLKYFDNFDHTHLGWIGKSKGRNVE